MGRPNHGRLTVCFGRPGPRRVVGKLKFSRTSRDSSFAPHLHPLHPDPACILLHASSLSSTSNLPFTLRFAVTFQPLLWFRAVSQAHVALLLSISPFMVGKSLSKNEKAQKLALQHWLEETIFTQIDLCRRYGHNLHLYCDSMTCGNY
ncbi:uncharacterized protein LOC144571905 [Carex rostrata]